jgi:DNA-binding transcriptional MerR regulator
MVESLGPEARRPVKSASAFRTISEVAQELEVPQHVLRFWESKFSQIRPLKRGGGRRYYRPEDVVLLRRIRQCLYDEGYTIKGVQRLLRERALSPAPEPPPDQPAADLPGADLPAAEAARSLPSGELDLGIPPLPARPIGPAAAASPPPAAVDALPPELRGIVEDVLRELTELRDLLRRR